MACYQNLLGIFPNFFDFKLNCVTKLQTRQNFLTPASQERWVKIFTSIFLPEGVVAARVVALVGVIMQNSTIDMMNLILISMSKELVRDCPQLGEAHERPSSKCTTM